jgi:hypothetical protein
MKNIKENLKLIIVALVLLLGINYVYAGTFTPAPSNPPAGDVDSFLKTGTDDQVKPGSLSVNAFSVDKMSLLSSKVFVNGIVRGYGTPETVHFGDSSNSVAMHAYGKVETTKDFYGNPALVNSTNQQLCADNQGNIVFCTQAPVTPPLVTPTITSVTVTGGVDLYTITVNLDIPATEAGDAQVLVDLWFGPGYDQQVRWAVPFTVGQQTATIRKSYTGNLNWSKPPSFNCVDPFQTDFNINQSMMCQ